MIFNSVVFLIFFAVFYISYLLLKNHKYRMFLCLVASYFFYGWWDWRFLSLILFSTFVDFYIGGKLHQEADVKKRKTFLIISLFSNLGLLFFFKYFNFFIDSFIEVANTMGMSPSVTSLNIILPVGISFYTFQTLSYTIDIYRKKLEPASDFFLFATYVSFFPQLVAGPIIRAIDLLPQFKFDHKITTKMITAGLFIVLVGYFKKVVVADTLAALVDHGFENPYAYTSLNLIIIVVFYAFQIYCDFSGYSDIATGIGKMLGFEFPKNFNLPYIAKNFSDFWQRWHISLSSWLRDYLYIPLGGNRHGNLMTQRNLMLTMLLGGLWHGANWTFVIWGFLHGSYLILQRLFEPLSQRLMKLIPGFIYSFFSIIITFLLVNIAWIFFRSQSVSDAFDLISYIGINRNFSFSDVKLKFQIIEAFFLICVLYGMELFHLFKSDLLDRFINSTVGGAISVSLILWMILLFGTFDNNNFIYFQF